MAFAKCGEIQDLETKGRVNLVQLPVVPVLGQGYNCALHNEGSSSNVFGNFRMSYGSRIHIPFLSTCCRSRAQRVEGQ